ncbi:MAG TPA: DUF3995 domain-containing protein [Blastocatellia bacterium]|jgi:hypothetical protein|nr:DUF3995 domain-containing protein [Blastocatellia bacterium]
MTKILGIFLAAVFAGLCLLHVFWASGGSFGKGATVPSVAGKRVFNPSPVGTMLVSAAFLVAMLVILGQLGIIGQAVPGWVFRWATRGIGALFLLRAIGEFRLVGFFKQVRATEFAFWDTWLFSPLCVVIAVIAFVVAYKSKAT